MKIQLFGRLPDVRGKKKRMEKDEGIHYSPGCA